MEDEVAPVLLSDNYYGEILFDYLEIFYKHALIDYAETHSYMVKLNRKVEQGKIMKDTLKRFKKYYKSLQQRREMLETQIDLYFNGLA
jgi:hypothetical protein